VYAGCAVEWGASGGRSDTLVNFFGGGAAGATGSGIVGGLGRLTLEAILGEGGAAGGAIGDSADDALVAVAGADSSERPSIQTTVTQSVAAIQSRRTFFLSPNETTLRSLEGDVVAIVCAELLVRSGATARILSFAATPERR
jgi:hypothetical protein